MLGDEIFSARNKLKIRAGCELDSREAGDLPAGTRVRCVQSGLAADGTTKRAQIAKMGEAAPLGWVSLVGKDGLENLLAIDGQPEALTQFKSLLGRHMPRLRSTFRQWDANNDGKISRAEFHRAMSTLQIDASKAAVEALFDHIDVNASGAIEYDELERSVRTVEPMAVGSAVAAAPQASPGGSAVAVALQPSPGSPSPSRHAAQAPAVYASPSLSPPGAVAALFDSVGALRGREIVNEDEEEAAEPACRVLVTHAAAQTDVSGDALEAARRHMIAVVEAANSAVVEATAEASREAAGARSVSQHMSAACEQAVRQREVVEARAKVDVEAAERFCAEVQARVQAEVAAVLSRAREAQSRDEAKAEATLAATRHELAISHHAELAEVEARALAAEQAAVAAKGARRTTRDGLRRRALCALLGLAPPGQSLCSPLALRLTRPSGPSAHHFTRALPTISPPHATYRYPLPHACIRR